MKTLVLLAMLGASGDVNYVKKSAPVQLNGSQISGLVSFIAAIAPDLTASNAIAVTCWKNSAGVMCQAQATATASPAAYIADDLAGNAVSITSVVP